MRHVLVRKTAHHVHDRVHFADMRQKFIAQPFAPGRALDQSRNVHEFDDRGGYFFAVVQGGEFIEPLVGYRHHAHVGLDGAERIIRGLCARVRDRVEKSGFAHVGKSHYA